MGASLKEHWPPVLTAIIKASGRASVKALPNQMRVATVADKCTCGHDKTYHRPACVSEIAMGADCTCQAFVSMRAASPATDIRFSFDETNPRATLWIEQTRAEARDRPQRHDAGRDPRAPR
jgi:hypothetical protein